jgi:hypothetical protein
MPPTRETNPIALNNLIGLVGQSSNRMRMVANAGQVTAGVARHLIQTQDNVRKQGSGSKPGKAANIERDRNKGHAKLVRDYFGANPNYTDEMLRKTR